ncbi:hypothetical protein BAE44_0015645 [Dichanthelium oligosanthes]|uniref:Uncharacterized protein n=1 Tax=Dichanthelium oligosanthes TaxID=888268 RepID=A0A1E5VDV7_9POAL|nr:hypothetical protein BAE44_0015645 [Dichanthelium oligosanthes]
MAATPAAAVLLVRVLVARSASATALHHEQAPRGPASISVVPPRRRRWRGPLRSLPPEGAPAELMEEDSKFVPLNADDPMYGPPALLLIGFEKGETDTIQAFLKELEGEFLKASSASAATDICKNALIFHSFNSLSQVIHCTEEMRKQTLWDAMHTEQPNLEPVKIADSLPRICIFSGLTGEEMMMFVNAFPETGLEPAAFAALVPNSAEKILGEVKPSLLLADRKEHRMKRIYSSKWAKQNGKGYEENSGDTGETMKQSPETTIVRILGLLMETGTRRTTGNDNGPVAYFVTTM